MICPHQTDVTLHCMLLTFCNVFITRQESEKHDKTTNVSFYCNYQIYEVLQAFPRTTIMMKWAWLKHADLKKHSHKKETIIFHYNQL